MTLLLQQIKRHSLDKRVVLSILPLAFLKKIIERGSEGSNRGSDFKKTPSLRGFLLFESRQCFLGMQWK